jgi:hypothetical protein
MKYYKTAPLVEDAYSERTAAYEEAESLQKEELRNEVKEGLQNLNNLAHTAKEPTHLQAGHQGDVYQNIIKATESLRDLHYSNSAEHLDSNSKEDVKDDGDILRSLDQNVAKSYQAALFQIFKYDRKGVIDDPIEDNFRKGTGGFEELDTNIGYQFMDEFLEE